MQIKRFEAQDMAEALRLIRREFGSEAVILSAKDINKREGLLGFFKSSGVEVTAATDTNNGKTKKENSISRRWTLQQPQKSVGSNDQRNIGRMNSLGQGEKSRLGRTLRPGNTRTHFPKKDHMVRYLNLYKEFQDQGVEEAIASDLIEGLRGATSSHKELRDEELKGCLISVLQEKGVAASAIMPKQGSPRIVALVGPPGVGKTTTIAKLAVIEAYQKGRKVAFIALNDNRIGAIAQLEAYGKILDVPVEAASSRGELKESISRLKSKDFIFIDTPGISPHKIYQINELKGFLETVSPVETHLLIAAGTKEKDFDSIFEKFGILPIDKLLFTKLDESAEYGAILNEVVRTKLPVSYFTNGQQVPENIEEASLERLVDLIWVERKESKHRSKRLAALHRKEVESVREGRHDKKVYVANKNSDLFHHPFCKWVERINEENMVMFQSRSEALGKNFHPCRICRPGTGDENNESRLAMTTQEGIREMAVGR